MLILLCKVNIHLFILQQLQLRPIVSRIHQLNILLARVSKKKKEEEAKVNQLIYSKVLQAKFS